MKMILSVIALIVFSLCDVKAWQMGHPGYCGAVAGPSYCCCWANMRGGEINSVFCGDTPCTQSSSQGCIYVWDCGGAFRTPIGPDPYYELERP